MLFHPFRYLIAGRPKWDIGWFDLKMHPDPRKWLEEKLGPLAGFEAIEGWPPVSGKAAVNGEHLRHPPPDKWVA